MDHREQSEQSASHPRAGSDLAVATARAMLGLVSANMVAVWVTPDNGDGVGLRVGVKERSDLDEKLSADIVARLEAALERPVQLDLIMVPDFGALARSTDRLVYLEFQPDSEVS